MCVLPVLLVILGVVAQGTAPPPTPSPTATPIPAATPAPRPMGLGFAEKVVPRPTLASPQVTPGQADSLASIASKIRLHKLTPEDLKNIHSAEESLGGSPKTPEVPGGLASDEQREAAMQEFEETFKVLYQRYLEVEAERRACNSACRGRTTGLSVHDRCQRQLGCARHLCGQLYDSSVPAVPSSLACRGPAGRYRIPHRAGASTSARASWSMNLIATV